MAYTFDYAVFRASYPEFDLIVNNDAVATELLVTSQAELLNCEVNGYCHLSSTKQACAFQLHLAHNLALRQRQIGEECLVTEIKSKNDMEKYAISQDQMGFGWSATTYGTRLQQLLKSCRPLSSIGAMSCRSNCASNYYW